MTALAGAEAMILALRVGFVVSLYLFVAAAIVVLRQSLASASPAVRAAPARLVLVRAPSGGDELGRAVTLVGPSVAIGRAPANDIVVRDDGVSARHARLEAVGDRWVLADSGSRNGTTLNRREVTGPAPLSHGDEIGTGELTWRFEVAAGTGAKR